MTEAVRRFTWVPISKLGIGTVFYGRMWRTPDGVTSGKFFGGFPMGVNVATLEWRFESDDGGDT